MNLYVYSSQSYAINHATKRSIEQPLEQKA